MRVDGLPVGRGVLDRSGMIGGGVKEEDVKAFFDGFDPESVRIYPIYWVTLTILNTTLRLYTIIQATM